MCIPAIVEECDEPVGVVRVACDEFSDGATGVLPEVDGVVACPFEGAVPDGVRRHGCGGWAIEKGGCFRGEWRGSDGAGGSFVLGTEL